MVQRVSHIVVTLTYEIDVGASQEFHDKIVHALKLVKLNPSSSSVKEVILNAPFPAGFGTD